MNTTATTLLVTIDHEAFESPLRFMCGRDFEVLRTDNTGQEVYGVIHGGQEYLFFPLSFHPTDAGVLELRLPPGYEDSLFGAEADGARVIFSSTHGTPVFAVMPEEYHSCEGVLRMRKDGSVQVCLDKVVPGAHTAEGCACGHDHADHACGCPEPRPEESVRNADDDKALAAAIRETVMELNGLLERADRVGLLVEVGCESGQGQGGVRLVLGRILKPI